MACKQKEGIGEWERIWLCQLAPFVFSHGSWTARSLCLFSSCVSSSLLQMPLFYARLYFSSASLLHVCLLYSQRFFLLFAFLSPFLFDLQNKHIRARSVFLLFRVRSLTRLTSFSIASLFSSRPHHSGSFHPSLAHTITF